MREQRINYCAFSFFLSLLVSCSSKEDSVTKSTLFTLTNGNETGLSFINKVEDTKDFNIFTYRNFYNGGGVGIGDINNDSLADIYFTSNTNQNKLYINKGNWVFEDITESAGVGGNRSWSTGVAMADVNGDGYLDIYVCNSGNVEGGNKENELFINNGDLTFSERAKEFGLNDSGYSTHASFFDFDLDGDLDCYMLNNSFKSIDRVDQFLISREVRDSVGGDKLLRNDDGHFIDVSAKAGIYGSWIGFGLGVSVSDLNNDMLPDIYISNDFWERDYLYVNRGDGTFSEELTSRTSIVSASSMGSDFADLNNDGSPEIFTTDMLPGDNVRLKSLTKFDETNIKELKVKSSYHYQQLQNCLQYNDGLGNFQELANFSNVSSTDWSWGALIFDMDNDGWKDIFVSNGIYRDITSMDFSDFVADRSNIKEIVERTGKFDFNDLLALVPSSKISNYAFVNERNKIFKNLADSLGLSQPSFSNGSAYGDLDNDGDLDLVVNNVNMPSFVYRNNTNELIQNNYLKVKLKGSSGNPFGIGSKVSVWKDGQVQVLQNFTTRGFQSSVEPQLLFGCSKNKVVDSVTVVWPDSKTQTLPNISTNQLLEFDYSKATSKLKKNNIKKKSLFVDMTKNILDGDYTHHENEFNDFDYERLLLKKVSTEGPKILVADLNGDDLDDFLMLGAFGDADKLFIQSKNHKFQMSNQAVFVNDSNFESTCGAIFDFDNDGDLDILLGSGGNEISRANDDHSLRYYQNDGRGKFSKVEDKFKTTVGNFSCILAHDYDQDGDTDLFVGARIVPGNYGLIPRSFLLRNDNGKWTDITPETLAGAGMVTGAVWSDTDGDSKDDLVVVGDWMSIKIYRNTGSGLDQAKVVPGSNGWWTAIEKADLNNDGHDDFVIGNWGQNSKFKASDKKPLKMFVNDFDQNGKSEFIVTWFPPLEERAFPFAAKSDLTSQLPQLKKNSLKYSEYASKTYEELLSANQRENALEYNATYLSSAILWNLGGAGLKLEALPSEVQVSPVFGIVIDDLNNDKHLDLLLCGNFYGLKPEVGRQDSNHGVLLKGDGSGKFISVPSIETGLNLKGEIRDTKVLKIAGKKFILLARNNASAQIFSLNNN
ncbi:MAG TPA: VCBS repeat-containing protein [Chryseolinea sp.]|nr:VCBS repeat-containing protein [Chryseolinea sp.]